MRRSILRRSGDSLVRSFREIVAFGGLGAESLFCDELYRRAKEILEESPFFGIKAVKQMYDSIYDCLNDRNRANA